MCILAVELRIKDFIMKNFIVLPFVSLFLLVACSKNSIDDPAIPEDPIITPTPRIETTNTILILRVDCNTYKFEGGFEKFISKPIPNTDSIPIEVVYKSPSDIGHITLYYKPSGDLLFDGPIIWAGRGSLNVPTTFDHPDTYFKTTNEPAKPDDSRFQKIFSIAPFDYSKIWKSISNLSIVTEYLKSNKKIGLLLYTPGVGVGDPAYWDWYAFLSK